jgi:hypothetical protein
MVADVPWEMASSAVACDSGKAGGEKSFMVLRHDPEGVDRGMKGEVAEEVDESMPEGLVEGGGREVVKASSRVTSQSLTEVEETPGSSEPMVTR